LKIANGFLYSSENETRANLSVRQHPLSLIYRLSDLFAQLPPQHIITRSNGAKNRQVDINHHIPSPKKQHASDKSNRTHQKPVTKNRGRDWGALTLSGRDHGRGVFARIDRLISTISS
jgi:hypothetical protein